MRPPSLEGLAEVIPASGTGAVALSVVGLDAEAGTLRVRSIEGDTGEAHTVTVPLTVFRGRELAGLAEARGRLRDVIGSPPFEVRRGTKRRPAPTYETLRGAVLELCREGIALNRFKGLGEMNSEQLWETTMDPERRILQRVTMEDAAAAELLFSMLMGEKVEPRREFIEKNAQAAVLDV